MMHLSVATSANWILNKLDEREHHRFLEGLQLVSLRFNDSIYDVGAPLKHVYFPIRGALSAMTAMAGAIRMRSSS